MSNTTLSPEKVKEIESLYFEKCKKFGLEYACAWRDGVEYEAEKSASTIAAKDAEIERLKKELEESQKEVIGLEIDVAALKAGTYPTCPLPDAKKDTIFEKRTEQLVSALQEVDKMEDKWAKVEPCTNWTPQQRLTSYLLLHEDLSISIGTPYQFDNLEGLCFPKMSVTHYMPLPDYPKDFYKKKRNDFPA